MSLQRLSIFIKMVFMFEVSVQSCQFSVNLDRCYYVNYYEDA
jgi:hypothetical protein